MASPQNNHVEPSPALVAMEDDKQPAVETAISKDEPQRISGLSLWFLVIGLLLTVFIMTLDMGILATAIPYITNAFDRINDIGWYGSAYLIATSSLQPLTGRIYTYFPLKHSYLTFLAIFCFGSLICGTAVSSVMLIVGRAIAGIGGSGLANGAMTIMAVEGPPEKRPMLLGTLFSVTGLGMLLSPLIGGPITEYLSWRWCFYINLPVAALTAVSILLVRFTARKDQTIDWSWKALWNGLDMVGFLLFVPASVMLFLALQWGGVLYPWSSATIIGLLCGSGVVVLLFLWWESQHEENAMFPLAFLGRHIIAAACLTGFLQGAGMMFLSYYLPLWFQVVKKVSPTGSAIRTLPTFGAQILFTIVGTIFIQRIRYLSPPTILGNALVAVGAGLMTTFTISTDSGKWVGYQLLNGAGRGLAMQSPFLAMQTYCEPRQLPVGTAMIAWSQFFGGALFVGLGQTVFANLLRDALTVYAPDVNSDLVVDAGATNYVVDVPADQQANVLLAYNQAITQTFYLAMGAAAAGVLTSSAIGRAKTAKAANKEQAVPVEIEPKS